MNKRNEVKKQLLYCMGTLDFFKNSVFNEESINFMLLQKILDNLSEVYNYVDNATNND